MSAVMNITFVLSGDASTSFINDASAVGAMSTIQKALPPGSLAVLGAWAVLQYTEVWNVNDGPLSGAIAWWRWNFWLPPTADNPTLVLTTTDSDPPITATESQSFLYTPTISYSNLITCWMFLLLIITPIKRGIFWDDYGSYAVALFTGFIVSWRSLSKFVVATPIVEASQSEEVYHRLTVTRDVHNDKSLTLNALSPFPLNSVYGIMVHAELSSVKPVTILRFLNMQTLCEHCSQVVQEQLEVAEAEASETEAWDPLLELLEQHDREIDCVVLRRQFRWTRSHSGQQAPLHCEDPNIAHGIAAGGLGAWRLQKPAFVRRLHHLSLFLAIAIPLSSSYQVIWALLQFAIPIFGNMAKDGSPLYFPLNGAVQNGIYSANHTLIHALPSVINQWTNHIQYILGTVFVVFGATTFIIASLEAWAAQLSNPSSIFGTRTLRMMSCYIMALSSFSVGPALSFALGYELHKSAWRTGLQYTVSLLISGVCLGASYAWRAHSGTMGDDKSWLTPLVPQRHPLPQIWANFWHAVTKLFAFCTPSCMR